VGITISDGSFTGGGFCSGAVPRLGMDIVSRVNSNIFLPGAGRKGNHCAHHRQQYGELVSVLFPSTHLNVAAEVNIRGVH
jgi:hypothetical protein